MKALALLTLEDCDKDIVTMERAAFGLKVWQSMERHDREDANWMLSLSLGRYSDTRAKQLLKASVGMSDREFAALVAVCPPRL